MAGWAAAAWAAAAFAPAFAWATDSACPKTITTLQSLRNEVKGWEAFFDPNGVHILNGVSFYEGNPREGADLAPDNADEAKAVELIWSFTVMAAHPGSGGIWQVCRYTNTRASLARKLAKGVKSCRMKVTKGDLPGPIDCE